MRSVDDDRESQRVGGTRAVVGLDLDALGEVADDERQRRGHAREGSSMEM